MKNAENQINLHFFYKKVKKKRYFCVTVETIEVKDG